MKFDRAAVCGRCFRPKESCLCGNVPSFDNRITVVILQHPQEQLKALNSARLAHLLLKNGRLFVGLSWPELQKSGRSAGAAVRVGRPVSGAGCAQYRRASLCQSTAKNGRSRIRRFSRHCRDRRFMETGEGALVAQSLAPEAEPDSLNPDHPSLRPQIKEQGLSTIEAISFALGHLGENNELTAAIMPLLRRVDYKEKNGCGNIQNSTDSRKSSALNP